MLWTRGAMFDAPLLHRRWLPTRLKMEGYQTRYRSANFSNQKIELDGKSFIHCDFQNCLIILERGETELSGCSFKNCKLLLKGNAYTIGKIIKFFTRDSPLKVLDIEQPWVDKMEQTIKRKEEDL